MRLRATWRLVTGDRAQAQHGAILAHYEPPCEACPQEAIVVASKPWDWSRVTEPIWGEPSPEVYPLAVRWRQAGMTRLLDLGCGAGRNALFLARAGFAVQASDLSPSGVARLQAQAAASGLAIGVTLADMLALPYADDIFDGILAFHAVYHTDRCGIETTIAEMERVLVPGGELYVTFNSTRNPSFADPTSRRLDANTLVKAEGLEAGIPHYFVDEAEVRRLLAHFDILQLSHLEEIGEDWRSCHYFALARLPGQRQVSASSGA